MNYDPFNKSQFIHTPLHETSSVYRGANVSLHDGEGTDLWQEWMQILHAEYRVFRSCFHTVLFMPQLCHSSKCYGVWGISIGWASTFISVFRQSFHYHYVTKRNGVLPRTLTVAQLFIIFSNYFGRFSAERLLSSGMWCCTMCLTDESAAPSNSSEIQKYHRYHPSP